MQNQIRRIPEVRPTEEVILLDDAGNAIGTADKATVHNSDTALHLAFSTYVFDGHGNVLMTRRALTKPTWPGVWTNSCCGHPAPGESMSAAIRRRLITELRMAPLAIDLILPTFRYRAEMANGVVENEMCPVYRVTPRSQGDPDPAEVHEVQWIPWEDLISGRGHFDAGTLSPWCQRQLELLAALGPTPEYWRRASTSDLPAAVLCP